MSTKTQAPTIEVVIPPCFLSWTLDNFGQPKGDPPTFPKTLPPAEAVASFRKWFFDTLQAWDTQFRIDYDTLEIPRNLGSYFHEVMIVLTNLRTVVEKTADGVAKPDDEPVAQILDIVRSALAFLNKQGLGPYTEKWSDWMQQTFDRWEFEIERCSEMRGDGEPFEAGIAKATVDAQARVKRYHEKALQEYGDELEEDPKMSEERKRELLKLVRHSTFGMTHREWSLDAVGMEIPEA